MMEELNDDANGESSFEFVGGKNGEAIPKVDSASSTYSSSEEFLMADATVTTMTSPTTAVSSTTIPSSSSVQGTSHQPETSVPSMSPAQPSSSLQHYFPAGTTTPQVVPMYKPGSMSPVATAPHSTSPYFQPSGPFVPSPESLSTAHSPPEPSYHGSQAHCSAIDLPLGDSFVSSSGQPYQESNEGGVWGWIKGSGFLNKVAEKAKNSVDSMITTLDPGMKEIIYSGGDVNIVVASGSEGKVSAVREAFQLVFGKATVQGIAVQSSSIAPQPVGYSAGLKAAEERIGNLQQQGILHEHQVILAIENFLAELTPDNWFDLGCLLLRDPRSGITLQVYTEAIPILSHYVMQAKEQTPPDYPLGWSGYAVTIGQIMGSALGVHHSEWHQALTGVSRREIIFLAARTLAGMYKAQLQR